MKIVFGTQFTLTPTFVSLAELCLRGIAPTSLLQVDNYQVFAEELEGNTTAIKQGLVFIQMLTCMVALDCVFAIKRDGFHFGSVEYYHEMDMISELDEYIWIRVIK